MRFLDACRRFRRKTERGGGKYGSVLFAAGCCAVFAYALHDPHPPNYVLMHNVRVLDRLDEQTFKAEVVNPATREWSSFVVKSCPEFEPTHEIQGGVTLTLLQYVEDRSRSCMELDGKWAGYVLLRDERGNPVRRF